MFLSYLKYYHIQVIIYTIDYILHIVISMKTHNKFSKFVKVRYNRSRGDYALNIPKKMSNVIPNTIRGTLHFGHQYRIFLKGGSLITLLKGGFGCIRVTLTPFLSIRIYKTISL